MQQFESRSFKRQVQKIGYTVAKKLLVSLVSQNRKINRQYFSKVYDYMSEIVPSDYNEDNEVFLILYLIKEIARAKIELKMVDMELIFDRIVDNSQDTDGIDNLIMEIVDTNQSDPISDSEIVYLSSYMTTNMRFRELFENATEVSESAQKLIMEDYDNIEEAMKRYAELIEGQHAILMKHQIQTQAEEDDYDIRDEGFNLVLQDTLDEMADISYIIKTGIRRLNDSLGGGFKKQELTIFFAPPAMWKSGMLLNIAIWAIKYNDLKAKDASKTPTVLYLSLENTKKQTVARQLSYLFNDSTEVGDVTGAELHAAMEKDGWFEKGNNFLFKYRPTESMDSNDIREIYEKELAENDNEIVLIVVDYLRRLKEIPRLGKASDEYVSLGNKSDDLANLAKELDLPIVTGSQTNRDADAIIEKIVNENKSDAGKKIGRTKVAESKRIIDNMDHGYGQVLEYSNTLGKWFISLNNYKQRNKKNKKVGTYFAHPFEINNGMRLVEDVLLEKSVSQNSIGGETQEVGKKIAKVGQGNSQDFTKIGNLNNEIIDE